MGWDWKSTEMNGPNNFKKGTFFISVVTFSASMNFLNLLKIQKLLHIIPL